MLRTRAIDVRPATEASEWVSGQCILCDAWVDLTLPIEGLEVYVEGEDTGFLVCDDCCAMPLEDLGAAVRQWVDDVMPVQTQ